MDINDYWKIKQDNVALNVIEFYSQNRAISFYASFLFKELKLIAGQFPAVFTEKAGPLIGRRRL